MPAEVTAATLNEYVVPFVRPVTLIESEVEAEWVNETQAPAFAAY